MKKILLLLFFIISFTLSSLSQLRVTVIEDSLFSKSLNGYMKFNMVLPSNYYLNDERYTTLYLLHGYSRNQDDWVTNTGLVSYAKDYNFIIVTPDAKNKWYTNSPTIKNNQYEDYIIKDLIPFVENKYRTLSTRHGRAIAGISMGGYGAIKLGLKYSNVFFYAASISGGLQFPGNLDKFFKSNDMKWVEQSLKDAFGETPSEYWSKNDALALADSIPVANMHIFMFLLGMKMQ